MDLDGKCKGQRLSARGHARTHTTVPLLLILSFLPFLLQRVGSLLICVEWLVFCCTHTWGAHWKSSFSAAPGWAKAVMAHGFKTPVGVLAIAGLHVLPIWLYVRQQRSSLAVWGPLQPLVDSPAMLGVFLLGRAVCLTVELWVLFKHCDNLLVDDVAEKRKE